MIVDDEVNVQEATTSGPVDMGVILDEEHATAPDTVPDIYDAKGKDHNRILADEQPVEQQPIVDKEEPMAPNFIPTESEPEPEMETEVEREQQEEAEQENEAPVELIIVQPAPSPPKTPVLQHQIPIRHHHNMRTVTTTTTVPMHFTPIAHKPSIEDAENIPPPTVYAPTFDRAAALAAIEYRRGRAKSIASGQLTPRKQMLEGVKERRDISAPALGGKTVGGLSYAKGASSVGRAGGRRMG